MSDILSEPGLLIMAIGLGVSLLFILFAFGDDSKGKQSKRVDRLRQRGHSMVAAEALQLRRDSGDQRALDQFLNRFVPRPELMRQRLQRTGRSISLGSYSIV